MKQPLVSIIMPTYNHAKYITQAIDGVLMQKTDFNVELLIGEDDSIDGTRDICREYASKYPDKIRLFLNDRKNVIYINGHPTGRWNFLNLWKNCQGVYIAICEGDDFWTNENKLQQQVDLLEKNPGYAGSFHETQLLYEDGKIDRVYGQEASSVFYAEDTFASLSPFHTSSFMFKNVIRKYPGWFVEVVSGDMALFSMVAAHGPLVKIPEIMSVYRKIESGLTNNEKIKGSFHLDRITLIQHLNEFHKFKYNKKANQVIAVHEDHLVKQKKTEKRNLISFLDDQKSCVNDQFLNISLTPDNIDLFYIRASIKKAIDRNLKNFRGTFLDVGCGKMPYRDYIITNSSINKYIGLDIENQKYQENIKPDIYWDGKQIDLPDNSVDSAMATEVLEHVPNIETVLGEILRVLKPGGVFFFTVPYLWPLHDMPHDEYRYTPFSLKRHIKNSGFTDTKIEALGGWDSSLAQMIGLWLKRRPMSEKNRSDFSAVLFPFYKQLLTFESQNKPPTYDEMLKNSMVITGLAGTAQKPVSASASVPAKTTTAKNTLSAVPVESALQHKATNEGAKPVLAIVCPQVGAISETFIRKHIELLMPNRTVILTGEILSQNWFQGPIKKIPIQLGKYSFNKKQEEDVTNFLKEHFVTHILCEFGCIGGAVVELNHQKLHLPIYVHFHGQDASEFIRRPEIAAYYKWMGNVVSGIVSVSKPMAERLFRVGIPKEKIQIIHYGVVYENRCKTLPENSPCKFISVSRLVGKKGIRFVLQAFVEAKKIVPEITLDIIGDGEMRGEIEEFIVNHALTKSVKLHGEQPHKYVLAMLEQSSVFVQHSIVDPNTGNAEGLPLSILEASAHGLPVISTFHEGIPEAIVHKKTGFLVQERDCKLMSEYIVKLANDGKLRKEMGLAGRKRILNDGFTVEVMIKKLRKFIGLGKEFTDIGDVKPIDKPAAINRVLFVNHNLYPYELSGTPISTLNNAMGIKKKGAKVAILIPSINIQNDYVKEVNKDYILYKVPKLDKYDSYFGDLDNTFFIKYISTIEKIIHDFKPEIVHINDYVFMPAQIVSLFSKSGAYVIRNVCNPEELCHLDSPVYFDGKQNVLCSGPKSQQKCAECFLINVLGRKKNDINEFELRQYSKKIQRRFEAIRSLYQKDVDGVLFTEKSFKNYFKQFINIPNEMIKVNPRGFKFDEPRKDEKRKEHSGLIHIGFIGNFIPRKGIDIILKAFIKISYLDNFILDIYGSESVKTYQAVIKKLEEKFPGKIKFHGKFRHSELARIAATLDFALVPSYFDTFNRVVRELMYFGIPLIVTDFFGASIIENNVNGIKIKIGDSDALADSMKRILLNPSTIEKLSIGVSVTKIASLDDEIEGIYDFYKDIISKKGGKPKENKHPQIVIEPDEEEKSMVVSDIKLQRDLVSIVILTFNELKYTKMCIDSIEKHTPEPHEIVFVDNASKDGTVEWLRKYTQENTNCKLIENQNNLGFAAGNNQGLSIARGDCLLLLNNDVVVTPGWLERLLDCAKKNADIGIVGPLSNCVAGPQLVRAVSYDTTSREGLDEFAVELSRKNTGNVKRLPRVVGFCMLIKRDVVTKIGGLDSRYGLGNFEDDDFSLRAVLGGYGSCIAKDCFIHHFGNRTFKGANIDYQDSLEKNWEIFKAKWGLPEGLPYGESWALKDALKGGFDASTHFIPLGHMPGYPEGKENSACESAANRDKNDSFDKNAKRKTSTPGIESRDCAGTNSGATQVSLQDRGDTTMINSDQTEYSPDTEAALIAYMEEKLQGRVNTGVIHNDLGIMYCRRRDYQKAFDNFKAATDLDPENGDYQKNLGDFHYSYMNDSRSALMVYKKLLTLDPMDVNVLTILGHIHVTENEFGEARVYYQRIMELDPGNAEIHKYLESIETRKEKSGEDQPSASPQDQYYKVQTCVEQGDVRGACAQLEKLVASYPEYALAHNDLGVLYYKAGDKQKSLAAYERAVELEPQNITFKKNLADFKCVELKQIEAAVEIYNEILAVEPDDLETLLAIGQVCNMLGQKEDAVHFFNQALDVEPWNAEIRQLLEEVERGEKPVDSDPSADEMYAEAQALAENNKTDEAQAKLQEIVAIYPNQAVVHNDLGVLHYQSGDAQTAVQHYEKAVEIEPNNVVFRKNLADFYCVEQGRVEEAMQIYVDLLAQAPDDVEILMTLGQICERLEKTEDARQFYEMALNVEPWNAQARQLADDLKDS